jgi:hypothetical protein
MHRQQSHYSAGTFSLLEHSQHGVKCSFSLVERYVRDVEAGGSNPLTPTTSVDQINVHHREHRFWHQL